MITHPTAEQLARAVGAWIDEIRPQLDERNAFLARVAANAVALIGRELAQGAEIEAAAADRFAKLLGFTGGYEELSAELCARLRAGVYGVQTPGLLAALKASALDQLAIDQPNYKHEAL